MIDRNKRGSTSVPFYKQLKEIIVEEIESGKLQHGDKLPSERDLAEQFNISRMTARHAISILEREGVVERRVGAGTFIARKRIEMDFITFNSFTKTMLERGMVPSTREIQIRRDKAKSGLAKVLAIEPGEEIVMMKRLRLADDIPVALEESLIPVKFCPGIETYIGYDVSLYQVLEDQYGIKLVRANQYMQVGVSDEEESKLLKIKNESPCILLEAVAFDTNGRPIEFSKSMTRSDIVKFYMELNLQK
ncbi:GntR family transcriptional regulator [Brevibacillus sp. B_LB10_24]|uniref:GntR family transcriptional regulator n=1 Tax=Brevibacillus sp. B_LB10_24 TaxID=3380645 RepID=UPI0038BA1F24